MTRKARPCLQKSLRRMHRRNCKSWDERHSYLETCQSVCRRFHSLSYPSSNNTVLKSTQKEALHLQALPENRQPGVQKSEVQEIAPGDIKYRLEPLPKIPPQIQHPTHFNQYFKPQWLYREGFKPWKMEPATSYGENPSHSVSIQGRKVAPIVHPSYMEYISQYQTDSQAPVWSRIVASIPDKSSLGIKHDFFSSQTTYLPLPKSLVQAVKAKYPSSTLKVFKDKFRSETTSKQFFQDWSTQFQMHYGNPLYRGYEKPLAPFEDQTIIRTSYMPLFSERVELYTPKTNSIKFEARTMFLLRPANHPGQSSCLEAGSKSICATKTQKQKIKRNTLSK